jgi:energy-coupling factor transport system permease protein
LAVTFAEAQVLGWLIFLAGATVPIYVVFGVVRLAGLREITRYEKGHSFLYGLNPGTKLLALVLVAVSARFAGVYQGLIVTSVILVSYGSLLQGLRKFWIGFLLTLSLAWGTVWGTVADALPYLIAGETRNFTPLAPGEFESFLVNLFSYQYAISGVFLLALLMVMTSTPSDLMRALRKVKMPNPITFSLMVGMRAVPMLLETINSIMKVQLMRGFGSRGRNLAAPLYVFAAAIFALIPSLIYLLRGARNTAISTGTRAFGAYKTRTYMTDPPFGPGDVIVIVLAVIVLLAALFTPETVV